MSGTKTALIVLTCGRKEYLQQAIASVEANLIAPFPGWAAMYIFDDSGNAEYRDWLLKEYGSSYQIIPVGATNVGFTKAMCIVWKYIRFELRDLDYVFHLEEDFVFNRPVAVSGLIEILKERERVLQVALVRQAWFGNEIEHGGVINALEVQDPGSFIERQTVLSRESYIEHRRLWTNNPCLYRTALPRDYQWPDRTWSESHFGHDILRDKNNSCAYYGRINDEPIVEHIGADKKGGGH